MSATVQSTEGALAILSLCHRHTATEVARRVDVSDTMVREVAKGRKTPGPELQEKIWATWGVPLAAWTTPAAPSADVAPGTRRGARPTMSVVPASESRPASSPAPRRSKATALEDLADTIDRLDAALRAVEGDGDVSIAHVASLFRVKVDAVDRLAKLRGEGELTFATIAKSAAWRRYVDALEAVLAKHPDAALAVADLFDRLQETGS